MAIKAKRPDSDYIPTPDGTHNGVCVDVFDCGVEETKYGERHRVLIVWEIEENHPEFGNPFRVNKKYTLSLHERAALRNDLESWRGKEFTEKELEEGFDLEKLLGVPCTLNVIHNKDGNSIYANVKAVMPATKDNDLEPSEEYVRIAEREEEESSTGATYNEETGEIEPDDELPF